MRDRLGRRLTTKSDAGSRIEFRLPAWNFSQDLRVRCRASAEFPPRPQKLEWRRTAIQEAQMGLLDILTGMQNGPHGNQSQPGQQKGGMSPLMMALLGLLAYKAVKGMGGDRPAPSAPTTGGGGLGDILGGLLGGGRPSGVPSGMPSGMPSPGGSGGLGDILAGGLGGSVLSGGLGNLVKQMQQNGYGRQAQSWVGHGENEAIPPDDLAKALGADDIDRLTQQTGMDRDELLSGLSQHLPNLVDQLTPEGRVPTEEEASEMA
jgi:uncharacterized protein YidB (DUF937 family)